MLCKCDAERREEETRRHGWDQIDAKAQKKAFYMSRGLVRGKNLTGCCGNVEQDSTWMSAV